MGSAVMKAVVNSATKNVEKGYGPFAAAIVRKGKIVVSTVNAVTQTNDPTAHAEIRAIREACKILNRIDLSDCELYTSCEPCPMCLGAIYWAGIKRVYYAATRQDAKLAGFDDEFIYSEIDNWYGGNSKLMYTKIRQVNVGDNTKPFKAWESFGDKKEY